MIEECPSGGCSCSPLRSHRDSEDTAGLRGAVDEALAMCSPLSERTASTTMLRNEPADRQRAEDCVRRTTEYSDRDSVEKIARELARRTGGGVRSATGRVFSLAVLSRHFSGIGSRQNARSTTRSTSPRHRVPRRSRTSTPPGGLARVLFSSPADATTRDAPRPQIFSRARSACAVDCGAAGSSYATLRALEVAVRATSKRRIWRGSEPRARRSELAGIPKGALSATRLVEIRSAAAAPVSAVFVVAGPPSEWCISSPRRWRCWLPAPRGRCSMPTLALRTATPSRTRDGRQAKIVVEVGSFGRSTHPRALQHVSET